MSFRISVAGGQLATYPSLPSLSLLPWATVLCLLLLGDGSAEADVIHVPAQFSTIQEAVDVAHPGDEIELEANYYSEDVTIDKEVIIRGANPGIATGVHTQTRGEETLIENSCFLITAPNVEIDGLLFRGGSQFEDITEKHAIIVAAAGVHIQSTIFENISGEKSCAIIAKATQSDDIFIEECAFLGNTCALRMERSSGGILRKNRIEAKKHGVVGVETDNSRNLTMERNRSTGHSRAEWVIRHAGLGIVAQGNQFEGTHYALIHEGGEMIDLRNCYWGDDRGPAGKISGSGKALTSPWSKHALFSNTQNRAE